MHGWSPGSWLLGVPAPRKLEACMPIRCQPRDSHCLGTRIRIRGRHGAGLSLETGHIFSLVWEDYRIHCRHSTRLGLAKRDLEVTAMVTGHGIYITFQLPPSHCRSGSVGRRITTMSLILIQCKVVSPQGAGHGGGVVSCLLWPVSVDASCSKSGNVGLNLVKQQCDGSSIPGLFRFFFYGARFLARFLITVFLPLVSK
jgi:hypothetical protein